MSDAAFESDDIITTSSAPDNVLEFAVKPKNRDTEALVNVEYGVSSTLPGSSFATFFEQLAGGRAVTAREAPNRSTLSIDQLVEMRKKDGQIRALVRLLSLPVRVAFRDSEWVTAEDDDDSESPETEFANQVWSLPPHRGGMVVPRSKLTRQILLSLVEGTAVFEDVRYVPDDGPLKGKIVPKKLAHRDARTIRFLVDDKGNFDGVRQVAPQFSEGTDIIIPKDKVWYYAANEEENPFYGISYFESAYFHWELKRKLYYISHLAAQMSAVTGRVGKVPPSASRTQTEAFKKALDGFAFNTAMAVPDTFAVEFANMNSNFNFLALIDHHNTQMSKSVLAKFLDDENRQVLIQNADSDASADFFVQAIESIIWEISESLSMFWMPRYIDWNFTSKRYPILKPAPLTDTNKDAIKELYTAVASVQSTKWTPEFIRELEKKLTSRFGLDIDYDEIAKREEEERAKMEEQQQLEQQQTSLFFNSKFGGQPGGAQGGGAAPAGGGAQGGGGKPPVEGA